MDHVANPNALLTAAQAHKHFGTESREVVYMWVRRYGVPIADRRGPRGAPRYRRRDLLEAEAAAAAADTGRGRHRGDRRDAA